MRPTAVLVLAALLLAGCASSPTATKVTPASAPAVVVTSLSDEASLTNQTFMNESHQHDYWGGKTELVVMDQTQQESGVNLGGAPLPYDFLLDSGHVVPQGTDKVTITVSWQDGTGDTHGAPDLWVRKPNQHDAAKVATISQSGSPFTMATTLADADVPHQQLSAWRFTIEIPPATTAGVVFTGQLTVKVAAHRGLEIPLLPPHPDLWNGKEAIGLLDEQAPLGVWDGLPPRDYRCYGSCPVIHRPPNGTVVPFDTAMVEVMLRTDDPSVDQIGLLYHAADTWNWTKLQPSRVEGKVAHYLIRVTPLMGDGPYAAQSLWEFTAYVKGPREDGFHVGTYHIQARALKTAALAG